MTARQNAGVQSEGRQSEGGHTMAEQNRAEQNRATQNRATQNRAKQNRAKQNKGFTLLELLVALAIFALLGGMTYLGIVQLVRAREMLQSEADNLQRVRLVFAQLEADLEQVVPRLGRSGFGADEAPIVGDSTSVRFTRFDKQVGAGLQLKRVGIGLRGRQLERIERLRLDPGPLEEQTVRVLHAEVENFELRYWDAQLQVVERWPPIDVTAPVLPRAVEIRLQDPVFGSLRRLILLPESDRQLPQTPG